MFHQTSKGQSCTSQKAKWMQARKPKTLEGTAVLEVERSPLTGLCTMVHILPRSPIGLTL